VNGFDARGYSIIAGNGARFLPAAAVDNGDGTSISCGALMAAARRSIAQN
jgi:hypothetical protein